MDAMAIVRACGRPTLFITVTCNPRWPEITEALLPGQVPEDRPDLVARVFRAKLVRLVREVTRDGIFGKTAAFMSVIEFQKRGKFGQFAYTINELALDYVVGGVRPRSEGGRECAY